MIRNSSEERDLVARLRAGDASAVADLHAIYGPKIHQLAFRHLGNHEDAEEVAQDVLLKVFRKIDAFRGDAALSSWVYRITFNASMSRLRRLKSRPAPPTVREGPEMPASTPAHEVDWSAMGDEAYMRSQLRSRFVQALREMPRIYRIPVLLRDIRGLSTEEASRALRVNVQTLKSRLHRGRLFLRNELEEFATGLALHRATS
ncbi:MAG: sigma-70 family RNA polymerase sigma factor [Vicinamibacterales bacterium]